MLWVLGKVSQALESAEVVVSMQVSTLKYHHLRHLVVLLAVRAGFVRHQLLSWARTVQKEAVPQGQAQVGCCTVCHKKARLVVVTAAAEGQWGLSKRLLELAQLVIARPPFASKIRLDGRVRRIPRLALASCRPKVALRPEKARVVVPTLELPAFVGWPCRSADQLLLGTAQ